MFEEVVPACAPETLLTRKQTTQALIRAGFPVGPQTLAYQAHLGQGPTYQIFSGYRALYRWGDALSWAQARLSTPRRLSTTPTRCPRSA